MSFVPVYPGTRVGVHWFEIDIGCSAPKRSGQSSSAEKEILTRVPRYSSSVIYRSHTKASGTSTRVPRYPGYPGYLALGMRHTSMHTEADTKKEDSSLHQFISGLEMPFVGCACADSGTPGYTRGPRMHSYAPHSWSSPAERNLGPGPRTSTCSKFALAEIPDVSSTPPLPLITRKVHAFWHLLSQAKILKTS
eukprot:888660-Rhodomonas_salina.1